MSYSSSSKYESSKSYRRSQESYSPEEDYDNRRHSRREYSTRRDTESKEKVSIPQMRYKLSKLTQAQTLLQIAMKTSGFYDLSANEADWIQRDVRSREFSSFSRLPIPDNCDYGVISKVIGENNYYLKLTTKNHDIDFIHYDDDANELHFWGEYQNCIRAMNELRYRIQKVSDRDEMKRAEAKRSNAYRAEMEREEMEREERERDRYSPSNVSSNTSSNSPYYVDDGLYHSINEEQDAESWNVHDDVSLDEDREIITFIDPKEQYSRVSKDQMNKMGFVAGSGLGLTQKGRLEPINAIQTGGRVHKPTFRFGLGYTEPLPRAVAPSILNVLVPDVPVPALAPVPAILTVGELESVEVIDEEINDCPYPCCSNAGN